MLALSFKNCKGIEYQKAVQYINKVEERVKAQYPESSISPIVYNQLLGIAPTQDDASYFFKRIERVDDFTLCNLLKIFFAPVVRMKNALFTHMNSSIVLYSVLYEMISM